MAAAEEERIQLIVREIVSSEIGEPRPPTNVRISESNVEMPLNVSGGFQNVNEELQARFQMPRSSFPANRGRAFAVPADEPRRALQPQIASNFNPLMNYGGIMNRRRPRRLGAVRYSQIGRRTCTVTSASRASSTSAEYKKDLILLPLPTWIKVPRGNDKSQLQKLGCYVDAVRFSKAMSEDEIKSKITDVFEQQLVDTSGNPVR